MALRFLAMHKEAGPYPMYVLLLLLAAYLLNQLDRYILAVTSQPMAQSIKFGDKGCLALNTSYTKYTEFCVKSLVDKEQTERNETWCRHKKTDNLTFSVCRWDYDGTVIARDRPWGVHACNILVPFSHKVTNLYNPCTSLRGTALGVYNWGIYLGYSMSYAFGNYITKADIGGKGWRWVFWIAAIPGFVVGALIVFTLKEPVKGEQAPMQ
ncbi:predicted protein, partial [Nematostella vectensis]